MVKIAELPAATAPDSQTMTVTTEWLKPLPPIDGEDDDDDDGWDFDTDTSQDDEPPF